MSDPERQRRKAEAFRALHAGAPFVIPNPWDVGSARMFEALGFRALATTSSGFAFTLGRLDGQVTLDEVAAHTAALDAATDLPVSVDLENGYGPDPEDAAAAIRRVAAAGAVGGSIEDYDRGGYVYELPHAVERVAAAVAAARALEFPFTLTARAENEIRGGADLDDTIARLRAYEQAGADVLYAPGLRNADEIRAVCSAVSKPVNVLAVASLSLDEIVAAGAQRVSVGGALAWVAVKAAADAATANLRALQEQAQAAGATVTNAVAGVRLATARLQAARAARDNAALQLSYTTVTAPAAGIVSKKQVEVGQLVQPGQPLMSVVADTGVWVTANFKETQLADLRVGQPVEIDVDAYRGATAQGVVESVSAATGATFALLPPDNATGNFTKVVQRIPVRIRVTRGLGPDRPLRPGMSVEAHVRTK
jgi:2-methylisocitrate lyase-like PEP mutase family enzyme